MSGEPEQQLPPLPSELKGRCKPSAIPDDVRSIMQHEYLHYDGHKGSFFIYNCQPTDEGEKQYLLVSYSNRNTHLCEAYWSIINTEEANKNIGADLYDEKMDYKYGRGSDDYDDYDSGEDGDEW